MIKKELEELTQLHRRRCEILGLNLSDPEHEKTPFRCAKADFEQFSPEEIEFTVFDNKGYDQMIVKPSIPFASLCSHHLYVYFGKCSIGYIPADKVCGLSKIARLVKSVAKGAHSQEWLTQKIADFLDIYLHPKGVIVMMSARHTCESCRGVKNNHDDSVFVTSAVKGVFADNKDQSRTEFFNLIK